MWYNALSYWWISFHCIKKNMFSYSLETPPGTKLYLKPGKIPMQSNFLLLSEHQFTVLGGSVTAMVEKWELCKVFFKILFCLLFEISFACMLCFFKTIGKFYTWVMKFFIICNTIFCCCFLLFYFLCLFFTIDILQMILMKLSNILCNIYMYTHISN